MVNDMKNVSADLSLGSERNYGIDLLRIVAMFYVVILHALGTGGILNAAAVGTVQYKFSWLLEVWTYGALNLFVLAEGYLSYAQHDRRPGWMTYIHLWLQVVFYGVAVTLGFNLFHPELVTKKDLFLTLFPVTNGLYWYLNAYTGLVVIMPLLNVGIQKCSERTLRKVFVLLFLVFSVYEVLVKQLELVGGYSFAWVVVLYLMGAIIRKCGIGKDLSFSQTMIGAAVLCLLAWVWKMFGAEFTVWGISVTRGLLISAISPAVMGISVLHVICFSKLQMGGVLRKIISFAAPAAFAVYILNCHRIIWAHVMTEKFAVLAGRPVHVMVFWLLAFSLAFLVAGILIDRVRIWLFDLLRVRKVVDRVVSLADRMLTRLADRL